MATRFLMLVAAITWAQTADAIELSKAEKDLIETALARQPSGAPADRVNSIMQKLKSTSPEFTLPEHITIGFSLSRLNFPPADTLRDKLQYDAMKGK